MMRLTYLFSLLVWLLLGSTLCAAHTRTITDISTLTTLPPAIRTGNNKDPCAFTDHNSLIDRVESDLQEYNISLLVATCDNVCPYVYGFGNPDLSGIGAFISFCIQGTVTLLFGPFLAVLYFGLDPNFSISLKRFMKHDPGPRTSHWFVKFAVNLSEGVHKANILTALALLIASITRFKQDALVAEVNFMMILAPYQYVIAMISVVSYFILWHPNRGRLVTISLYFCAVLALFIGVDHMTSFSSSKVRILNTITEFCVAEREYPVSMLERHQRPEERRKGVVITTVVMLTLFGVVMIGFYLSVRFMAQTNRITNFLWLLYVAFCHKIGIRPSRKRLFSAVALGTFTIMSTYAVTSYLHDMQNQRRELQRVSGEGYQDSQWGFGQVTAVLLWAPLFQDMMVTAIDTFKLGMIEGRRGPTWPRNAGGINFKVHGKS